jgi:two-component system, NtrC family, response regulator HupR/HoxA
MINWKELSHLHAITRMGQIINKWYGSELIFVDKYGKIMSHQIDQDYEFKSPYLKFLLKLPDGYNGLVQDFEKAVEDFSKNEQPVELMSHIHHVKMIVIPMIIESEVVGGIIGHPFVSQETSAVDLEEVRQQLKKIGMDPTDAEFAVASLKRLGGDDRERLKELLKLVGDEVKTYHNEITKRESQIQMLNSELGGRYRYHNMIGKSKKMQDVYKILDKISKSEASVFIHGENGTGKELVGKALHFNSQRKEKIFLAVNCSAFNDNLLDSELFGHVKGSFTGALKDKKGLFEQADAGTLFLDEIGDTSLSMQVKLLRVLQEGTFIPVGGTSVRKVDVRIIAATNKDLKQMMQRGEFREDLYYRINVISIQLPALRERAEDIPMLVEYFLERQCEEMKVAKKSLSNKCLEKFMDYKWPGNVRELENEIERLVVLSGQDKIITPDLLSGKMMEGNGNSGPALRGINMSGTMKKAIEELEILMIKEGLKRCNFNKSRLAKELDVSRASLIMKVEKYDLDKRKKAGNE